jgi:hypothetical protein
MADEQPHKLLVILFIGILISLPLISIINALFSEPSGPQQSILEEQHSPSFYTRARSWLHLDEEQSQQTIHNHKISLDLAHSIAHKAFTPTNEQNFSAFSPAPPLYPLSQR